MNVGYLAPDGWPELDTTRRTIPRGRFPVWVKLRRTHCEQMSSGLSLKADIAQYSRHVSKVPNSDERVRRRARIWRSAYYSHSHDCARTGPVEQVDWANPIAGCSGYSDRIS